MIEQRTLQKIKIKIQLKNEVNRQSRMITFQTLYSEETKDIFLNDILRVFQRKGFLSPKAQIFYVDCVNQMNVFLGNFPSHEEIKVKSETLVNNSLKISYRKIAIEEFKNQMIDERSQQKQNGKKVRQIKERTIGQAVIAVKKWRELYDTANETGRRLYTLQQAAKKVGMAKKTLDDYFNHMRIACEYKFNFERYEKAKVGILRKFVKTIREGQGGYNFDPCNYIIDNDTDKYWNQFN